MTDPKTIDAGIKAALVVSLVAMLVGVLVALFWAGMPDGPARDATMMIIGAIVARFNSVFDYFFGSSKGSADKQEALSEIAKQGDQPPK